MAFFCAGSSGEAKKKNAKPGSKPTAHPSKNAHAIGSIPNGGGRSSSQSMDQPMPSIPHSNSKDLPPNSRKMIVLQEYTPQDNRGLMVKRGESVQVISQDGNWLFVRNEWGKEGHVPSSHLVAPYSSMRSRSKSSGGLGHPMRPVASGSSIVSSDVDSSFSSGRGGVPIHMSQSAGRPRNFSSSDNHRVDSRRVVSPPSLSQNDIIITSMSQGTGTAYEQKYSPSSSSGVASMNGPLSPSYTSLQHSNSQENVDPHPPHSSGSSITHDQSSLSSVEEHEQRQCSMETPPPITNGHAPSNGHASSNERIRGNVRTLSESHISRVKTRPHKKGSMKHNYSTVADDIPPPVPPRIGHSGFMSNRGEIDDDRGDPYADPVDLVQQQHMPFTSNSLRREADVRIRDIRMAKENGEYSEVFPGGVRSRGANEFHYPAYHLSQENESEGGSSSRRSSKKSSSTCMSSHSRGGGYPQPRGEVVQHYDSRDVVLSLPDEDDREIEILPETTGQNPQTRIDKFRKFVWGVYIVTHEFESLDENEVSVHPGDHVSVFNQDDRDWYWVVKHSTAEEGFVPSCILEETSVPENSQYSVMDVGAPASEKPPPLPPKQPLHPSQGHTLYDHTQHFRQRAQSHDTRPPTTIVRRPSPATGHRMRGRLNSDGSTQSSPRSSNKAPSTSSIEKGELRESPPPPYSEYDRNHLPPVPPRHYSHTSHHQSDHPQPGRNMQRTRSHGQVQFRRQGIAPLAPIERSRSDRRVSPDQQVFQLRSPTTVTGGTLV